MGNRKTRGGLFYPVQVSHILKNSFKALGLERMINEWIINQVWDRVVGASISKSAMPSKMIGKTLYVTVANSVWMEELKYHKGDIINKLNKGLGKDAVSDVIFKIGHIEKVPCLKNNKPPAKRSLTQKEKDSIRNLTEALKAEELRNIISSVITKQKSSPQNPI